MLKANINGQEQQALPEVFARWVKKDTPMNSLSVKQQVFFEVGRWQNDLLLKKARLKP